ncbi:hypothetical protein HanPSC8_Chr06g0236221 [Helianthus annuus]|nr:hypothetical protein HanPSC8_Chr06g0236221 [Helianthus annuus]
MWWSHGGAVVESRRRCDYSYTVTNEADGEKLTGSFAVVSSSEVRALCTPLKAFGIHTVSLHSGASVDHQVHG